MFLLREGSRVVLAMLSMLLITAVAASSVLGHVPEDTGANDSRDRAFYVEDPVKSWAIYEDIPEGGGARFYRLELDEGDRLYVSVFTPRAGFSPSLAILSPFGTSRDPVPDIIDVPLGYGVEVVEGDVEEKPHYEPFTPSVYYGVAEYDVRVNVSGTYFVAVFHPTSGGPAGLAVGYSETWGPIEWVTIPFEVYTIHQWEGQPGAFIAFPFVLAFVTFGAVVLILKFKLGKGLPSSLHHWVFMVSGTAYVGSAGIMAQQVLLALLKAGPSLGMLVTILFVAVPAALGAGALYIGASGRDLNIKTRAAVFALGFFALVSWAGFITAPVIIMIGALVPELRSKAGKG